MSNYSTSSQQNRPPSGGLVQHGAISSPYSFTVNSELNNPPEERSPVQQSAAHGTARPVYQFMPHMSGQPNQLANIPYAVHSRDALQHGVSARVSSPTWDIERESIGTNGSQPLSAQSTPPRSIATPRSTITPAFSPSSAPPSVPRPYPRPVPRPAPSNATSAGQDDYSFFNRRASAPQPSTNVALEGAAPLPPVARRAPIVYVPETQPSQEHPYNTPDLSANAHPHPISTPTGYQSIQTHPKSLQSSQREYIFVTSSQPSIGNRPSQPVDLTGVTPPPLTPEPISKTKRGGSARGGSTRGAPRTRGSGRGRGRAKSSKSRGKQTALSEGEEDGHEHEHETDAPASKRRRTSATTEKERKDNEAIAAEAAIGILNLDSDDAGTEFDGEASTKFSLPENSLAFASAFYSVDSYEYCSRQNTNHAAQAPCDKKLGLTITTHGVCTVTKEAVNHILSVLGFLL